MMGLETIRDLSREAGEAAEAAGDTPHSYWRGDPTRRGEGFPFPNLGDYRPEGWNLVGTLFADATGWGAEDEPALTVGQLETKINEIRAAYDEDGNGVGFGIVEVGQFQVYVGVFESLTLGNPGTRFASREKAGLVGDSYIPMAELEARATRVELPYIDPILREDELQ
jgi:hypothetical protein